MDAEALLKSGESSKIIQESNIILSIQRVDIDPKDMIIEVKKNKYRG